MEMRPRLPSRYRHQGAQRSTSQNAAERTSIYLVEIRSSVPRRRPVPVRNRAARQVTGGRAGDAPPECAAAPQRQHRRPSHPSPPDPQAPESHGRATCHWPSGRRRLVRGDRARRAAVWASGPRRGGSLLVGRGTGAVWARESRRGRDNSRHVAVTRGTHVACELWFPVHRGSARARGTVTPGRFRRRPGPRACGPTG